MKVGDLVMIGRPAHFEEHWDKVGIIISTGLPGPFHTKVLLESGAFHFTEFEITVLDIDRTDGYDSEKETE